METPYGCNDENLLSQENKNGDILELALLTSWRNKQQTMIGMFFHILRTESLPGGIIDILKKQTTNNDWDVSKGSATFFHILRTESLPGGIIDILNK